MSIVLDGTTGITTPGLTNTGTETLVNLTTTGNTTLGDASTDTLNVGNGGLIKDASGNVGVGVTPSAWVSTAKGIDIGIWSAFANLNSGAASVLQNSWEYSAGAFKYKNTDPASKYDQVSGQHRWFNAPSGTAGNAITFTQAMTLQTGTYGGQQLLLNTTAVGNAGTSGTLTGSRLSVGVVAYSGSAYGCIRIQDTGSGTAFLSEWGILADGDGNPSTTISYQVGLYLCAGINGGSARIYFDGSGNAYKTSGAGSWLALSDSRIKTNVQTVTNGLSRVLQLNPVTFDYKSPEAHNGKVNDKGFIADEFMQVYPDSVKETAFVDDADKQYIEEGTKAKALAFNAEFYADLVSAIQEQQALITTLTDRITALEAR